MAYTGRPPPLASEDMPPAAEDDCSATLDSRRLSLPIVWQAAVLDWHPDSSTPSLRCRPPTSRKAENSGASLTVRLQVRRIYLGPPGSVDFELTRDTILGIVRFLHPNFPCSHSSCSQSPSSSLCDRHLALLGFRFTAELGDLERLSAPSSLRTVFDFRLTTAFWNCITGFLSRRNVLDAPYADPRVYSSV
jgi:hypothetical protein